MTGFSHDDVAAMPWGDDNWKERKAPQKIDAEKLSRKGAFKIHSVMPSYDYRGRPNGVTVHVHVDGRHHEMDTSRAEAAKLHTYAKKYHGATTPPVRIEHIKEAPTMKTLTQLKEELSEATDVTLHRHEDGVHYTVHKIHPKSGIESDQLKQGEKLNDTHVDDLRDMGYKVKIHKAK